MDPKELADLLEDRAERAHDRSLGLGCQNDLGVCEAEKCKASVAAVADLRRLSSVKVAPDPRIPALIPWNGAPPIAPFSVRGDRVVDATGRDLCAALWGELVEVKGLAPLKGPLPVHAAVEGAPEVTLADAVFAPWFDDKPKAEDGHENDALRYLSDSLTGRSA